jgi:hypothetical protein
LSLRHLTSRRRLLALLPTAALGIGAGCLGPAEIDDLLVRNLGPAERRMTLTATDGDRDELLFEETFTVAGESERRFPDALPDDRGAIVGLQVADGPETSITGFPADDHSGVVFTLDGDDLRADVRESHA